MNINENQIFLYFNFVNYEGVHTPLQFSRPVQIVTAQTTDEIISCLETIQQAINNGFYAAGYISYEAAPAFDKSLSVKPGNMMPLLWFGIFNKPIYQQLKYVDKNSAHPYAKSWKSLVPIKKYNQHFTRIQQAIENKRTKQVNYTIPFESPFSGDPLLLYKQLEAAQSANYSAYLNIGGFSIISASPELFFHLKDNEITTKPMKGTIDRGLTYKDDIKQAQKLKNSRKEQNENNQIVDLMCNELEKIAVAHTVKVPKLHTIEKYPTLYQMTSTITAKLQDHIELLDIFKTLFPCGSITGIPKEETMNIITEIETLPREVYCGAIGYITPQNEAIFNVPIRTVWVDKKSQVAQYGVGGAITSDSKKENEYEEILIKTGLLTKAQTEFKLIESFGLINGQYICFAEHMKRLKESAEYFNFNLHLDKIHNELIALLQEYKQGNWKVRLLVDNNGQHNIEIDQIRPQANNLKVRLAYDPIDQKNLFLYHKTTNRTIYEENKIKDESIFDTLLWNENDEVTEFTMGNIVVEMNHQLYTPPIKCGLLAGTFREYVLKKGEITERIIKKEELKHCDQIWFINSVRRWIPVQLQSSENNNAVQ